MIVINTRGAHFTRGLAHHKSQSSISALLDPKTVISSKHLYSARACHLPLTLELGKPLPYIIHRNFKELVWQVLIPIDTYSPIHMID